MNLSLFAFFYTIFYIKKNFFFNIILQHIWNSKNSEVYLSKFSIFVYDSYSIASTIFIIIFYYFYYFIWYINVFISSNYHEKNTIFSNYLKNVYIKLFQII